MVQLMHPDLCRQIAAERQEQLRRTAHVARLVREARAGRPEHRLRHRHRHRT